MDPILVQKQIRDNTEDLRNYVQDLKNWEADMKRKESELQAAASSDQALPPVRSKITRISQDQKSRFDGENERPARISGYDYASWDKFDVDKACEDLDDGRHHETEEGDDDTLSDTEKKQLREEAAYEKEMGNKFVKKQKWKEAIQCYSRAIKCFPYDATFYANRALCYLKTDNLRSAEVDCTTALQLDSSYVKAYQRRALARAGLGQLQEARSDLLKVMELEPKNVASKAELMKLEKKINLKSQPKQSVEQSGSVACSQNFVTNWREKTSSHTLKSKDSEDESDSRNGSVRSHKEITKQGDKVIPHISGKKTVATKEMGKKVKCSTNQEIMEQQGRESRLLENVISKEQIWPMNGEVKLVQTVHKPPHLRSKKPLKRIEIRELDNDSSQEHGTGTKTCSSGTNSVKIEGPQVVGSDPGRSSSDKEQKTEEFCKSVDAESSEVKPASEKPNAASQNTDIELLSEKELEDVPPIPNTSVQFLIAWKKVRTNPQLSYLYLKQIPGADLPKIFQDSLESSTFSDIIFTIKTGFLHYKEPVLPYIMGLSDVRRFSTLAMFLSESDKEGIKKILKYCKEQGECSEKESTDLMKKYELC